MLNNLTNFFNLIRGKRIKTELEPEDLIAIGTRQSKSKGDYKPTAIKFSELANQIGAGGFSEVTVNGILANDLQIGPSSLVTVTGTSPNATITLKPEIPYKAYRAKLTAGEIDWPGYGYLYNWFAVDDARGLANPDGGTGLVAPNEWRVPSDTDWDTLITFAGGSSVAGGKLKSTLNSVTYPFSFYGWGANGGGTDDYNFGGLGGGRRNTEGNFSNIAFLGSYWTSLSASTLSAHRFLFSTFSDTLFQSFDDKSNGFSVRLVREATAGELLLNDGDTSDTSSLDPYIGNDGTVYVTVKIGTQIWLAQNLRETLYNNSDPIFNAAFLPGGDFSNFTWVQQGIAEEGAWTVYKDPNTVELAPYLPENVDLIYTNVLENSLGATVNWLSKLDDTNVYYEAKLATGRTWYPTHIKLTPGYDVSDYDNSIPTLVQKNLIVKRAVTAETNIDFFPVTIDSSGTLTIEPLNNYSDLLGSPDSSVYVEILEYQPESYYYSSSLSQGIGVSNL
jgi:uncharacterized protein (TIGR02145 family)